MGKGDRKELVLPGKTAALFCDAVQYGDFIFTSGIVARNPDSTVFAPGDAEAQTRFIFRNISDILALADSSFQDIVKMTIYVRNMEDRLKINPIREEFFKGARPASTVVEVSKLAHPDLMVEVEVVAVAGSRMDNLKDTLKKTVGSVSKAVADKEKAKPKEKVRKVKVPKNLEIE